MSSVSGNIDIDALIAQAYQRGLEDAQKNKMVVTSSAPSPASPIRPRQSSLDRDTSQLDSHTKRQRTKLVTEELDVEEEAEPSNNIPITPTPSNRRSSMRAPQYSFSPGRKSLTSSRTSLNVGLVAQSDSLSKDLPDLEDEQRQFILQQQQSNNKPSTTPVLLLDQKQSQTPRKQPQFRLSLAATSRKSFNTSQQPPSSPQKATYDDENDNEEINDERYANMPTLLDVYRSPQLQHISTHIRGTPTTFKSPTLISNPTPIQPTPTTNSNINMNMNIDMNTNMNMGTNDENCTNEDGDQFNNEELIAEDAEFLSTLEWVTRTPHDPCLATKASYKILILGSSSSGKSSIVQRYTQNTFDSEYKTTIGADYKRKFVRMKNNHQVALNLFDIAGQSRFQTTLSRGLTRHARAAIIVFDITRPETFEAVRVWKEQINYHFFIDDADSANGGKTSSEQTQQSLNTMFPIILLMNKCDLLKKNVNQLLEMGRKLEKLKTELNFTAAFTTSAKDSLYINETFDFLADLLYKQDITRYIEFMKTFYPHKVKQDLSTGEWSMVKANELFNVDLDAERGSINAGGMLIEGENDIEKIISEAHSDPRSRKNLYNNKGNGTNPRRVNIDSQVNSKGQGGCC